MKLILDTNPNQKYKIYDLDKKPHILYEGLTTENQEFDITSNKIQVRIYHDYTFFSKVKIILQTILSLFLNYLGKGNVVKRWYEAINITNYDQNDIIPITYQNDEFICFTKSVRIETIYAKNSVIWLVLIILLLIMITLIVLLIVLKKKFINCRGILIQYTPKGELK